MSQFTTIFPIRSDEDGTTYWTGSYDDAYDGLHIITIFSEDSDDYGILHFLVVDNDWDQADIACDVPHNVDAELSAEWAEVEALGHTFWMHDEFQETLVKIVDLHFKQLQEAEHEA